MTLRFQRIALLAVAAAAVCPPVASAATGGMAAAESPSIETVRCVANAAVTCPAPTTVPHGGQVQIQGASLNEVRTVTFRGGAGRRDDVTVKARHVRPTHVEASVPRRAQTGKIELRADGGLRAVSRSAIAIEPPAPAATALSANRAGAQVFPIRGKHDVGQSATNNFGGARNHKGQDMFAACGTPLVAAEGGTVRFAGTQARAGNYAVITGEESGRDYVYMHMRSVALVATGDAVTTGQPLGEVGDTGNANGCHLHFELWSAPGWYEGGSAMDPLPDVRAWDAREPAHSH